ncbi:MAG: biopolymer transporter ExbB, partial [Elioraea tepidiphila]
HMAVQMEQLQLMHEQAEAGRAAFEARIADLTQALTVLGDQRGDDGSQSAILRRIADGQDRLIAALGSGEGGGQTDAESRMRLRSIDVQLLRILEEMSAGRQETLADLKTDIAALTTAIRQLGRNTAGR